MLIDHAFIISSDKRREIAQSPKRMSHHSFKRNDKPIDIIRLLLLRRLSPRQPIITKALKWLLAASYMQIEGGGWRQTQQKLVL